MSPISQAAAAFQECRRRADHDPVTVGLFRAAPEPDSRPAMWWAGLPAAIVA